MITNRNYAYDLSVPEVVPEILPREKDFKVIKTPKKQKQAKINSDAKAKKAPRSKLSLIASLAIMFTMAIVISYRYNIISEKNLAVQRLQKEKIKTDSLYATTEIAVDQIIDKGVVESYAKQQLGMQKPEKSQIVYINSEYETKVEAVSNNNIFEKAIQKIKNMIGM